MIEITEGFDRTQYGVYNQNEANILKSSEQPNGSVEDSDASNSLLTRLFRGYIDYCSAYQDASLS